MSWEIKDVLPTMATPDLEAGIRFYERLGAKVDWRWPDEGSTHAGLSLAGACLMLAECGPAVRADLTFVVDDVDACHAALLEGRAWELSAELGALADEFGCPPKRSLEPPPAPANAPYGMRDFSLVDPWGNQLTFGQAVDE